MPFARVQGGGPKAMSHTLLNHPRIVLLCALAGLVAGCAQPPVAPPAPPPAPAPTVPESEPPPPPPPPRAPATPQEQQQAQKTAMGAVAMLEAGHEDQARAELQKALALDAMNKLAVNLMRQITVDPAVAFAGKDSFSYTVKPNDTMSAISGRFLGDIYSFYLLARYNNIAVPRQVASGQVLRIPGKAPPPSAMRDAATPSPSPAPAAPITVAVAPAAPPVAIASPPAPPPPSPGDIAMRDAQSAERRGDLDLAYAGYARAAGLDQPGAQPKADQVKKQLVQRYSLNARTALAKEDLDGAIRSWDRVLVLDPGNDTARFERQKLRELKEKVGKI